MTSLKPNYLAKKWVTPTVIGRVCWLVTFPAIANKPLRSSYRQRDEFFIYEIIPAHREKGKTFYKIAELLNQNGYLSARDKV